MESVAWPLTKSRVHPLTVQGGRHGNDVWAERTAPSPSPAPAPAQDPAPAPAPDPAPSAARDPAPSAARDPAPAVVELDSTVCQVYPVTLESLASPSALVVEMMEPAPPTPAATTVNMGVSPPPDGGTYGEDSIRTATPSEVETRTDFNMGTGNDVTGPASGRADSVVGVGVGVGVSVGVGDCQADGKMVRNGSGKHHENNDRKKRLHSPPFKRLQHPAEKSIFFSCSISLLLLVVILVLFCPALVVYVIVLPVAYIVRTCIACCCCCARNRACACCCSRTLNQRDAFWLHDSPFNRMIVQALFTLEEGLDVTRIRDLVNAKLVCAEGKGGEKLFPRFTEKVVSLYSGYAWAKDTDFCIDSHIVAMPTHVRTELDLRGYISEMASKELDRERPLWEIHVQCQFGEANDTVLLLRMHPCVSDGVSLMRVLVKTLADNPSLVHLKPRFGQSAFAFNFLRAVFIGPLVLLQKWIFSRRDNNVLSGPPLSGRKVVAWSEPFSMEEATRIKQVTRSTFHDILLTVAAGNLRTYIHRAGVANPSDVRCLMPLDLRTDRLHIDMGSEMALLDLSLPANTEGAIPRLWEIKHRMDDLKNSADPVVMHFLVGLLSTILPRSLYQRIWGSILGKSSCMVAGLQGPDSPVTFVSRRVKQVVCWMPPAGRIGLSISFLTYADQLRMAVIADEAVLSDPHVLTDDFIAQMRILSQLLANRRIPGQHAGRRLELPAVDDDMHPGDEPTIPEIQAKLTEVQQQLQELKCRLDEEADERFSQEEHALMSRVEDLKEEFRELLAELRRKKAGDGGFTEDDEDGPLRLAYRKRSTSGSSRRSIVSSTSTARPLTTSPPHSHHHSSPTLHCSRGSTPSSPTMPVSGRKQRRYHTFHHTPAPRMPVKDSFDRCRSASTASAGTALERAADCMQGTLASTMPPEPSSSSCLQQHTPSFNPAQPQGLSSLRTNQLVDDSTLGRSGPYDSAEDMARRHDSTSEFSQILTSPSKRITSLHHEQEINVPITHARRNSAQERTTQQNATGKSYSPQVERKF